MSICLHKDELSVIDFSITIRIPPNCNMMIGRDIVSGVDKTITISILILEFLLVLNGLSVLHFLLNSFLYPCPLRKPLKEILGFSPYFWGQITFYHHVLLPSSVKMFRKPCSCGPLSILLSIMKRSFIHLVAIWVD